MEKLIVALLVAVLCLAILLTVQVVTINQRLDVAEQSERDMLEARIIVLEKNVERLKAKEELRNELPRLQDNSE